MFANPISLWIPQTNNETCEKKVRCSSYNLRNPLTFAESAYKVCGFHLDLRYPLTNRLVFFGIYLLYILQNPLTVAESRTTSYIRFLRNPQQNKCAVKLNATGVFTRNPQTICKWSPLTF